MTSTERVAQDDNKSGSLRMASTERVAQHDNKAARSGRQRALSLRNPGQGRAT
jgi:hypothetical protein